MYTGYAKSLQQEVSPLGIQTVIFNVGYIRTKLTSQPKISVPEIDDYKVMFERFSQAAATIPGNEPGDPKICAERIIDVMKGDGLASGKPTPFQIPLGVDAITEIRQSCEAMLKTCNEWEDMIKSIEFEGPRQGFWADTKTGKW